MAQKKPKHRLQKVERVYLKDMLDECIKMKDTVREDVFNTEIAFLKMLITKNGDTISKIKYEQQHKAMLELNTYINNM